MFVPSLKKLPEGVHKNVAKSKQRTSVGFIFFYILEDLKVDQNNKCYYFICDNSE